MKHYLADTFNYKQKANQCKSEMRQKGQFKGIGLELKQLEFWMQD